MKVPLKVPLEYLIFWTNQLTLQDQDEPRTKPESALNPALN